MRTAVNAAKGDRVSVLIGYHWHRCVVESVWYWSHPSGNNSIRKRKAD